MESRKKITIVIPAYNEEDNVEIAYKRLKEVLDSTNYDYELIFLASYTLNFLTLVLCIHILKINPYISQIISGAVYTISGFVFLKYFAFRGSKDER